MPIEQNFSVKNHCKLLESSLVIEKIINRLITDFVCICIIVLRGSLLGDWEWLYIGTAVCR